MSEAFIVQQMRLEFAEVLGDSASIADIMVFCAIACLESDYGRSRLVKDQNNYFGMKSPKRRPTLNVDPTRVFATFDSRRACVLDFVCWLVANNILCKRWENSRQLIDYIVDECGYCPDKGYKEKLIAVYEKIKNW